MKRTIGVSKVLGCVLGAVFLAGCNRGVPPAGGLQPGRSTSTLSFSIEDSCNDGYKLWVAFYDQADSQRWPTQGTGYTVTDGNTLNVSLSCYQGASVCYGAADNANDSIGYWGAGYNGTETCTGCCYTCNGAQPSINLTCSGDPHEIVPGTGVRHPQLPRVPVSSLQYPFGTGGYAGGAPVWLTNRSQAKTCAARLAQVSLVP